MLGSRMYPGAPLPPVGSARAGVRGDAIPAYRRALVIDPDNADARMGLALALSDTGRSAEAQREYERAESLDPGAARRRRYGASDGRGV